MKPIKKSTKFIKQQGDGMKPGGPMHFRNAPGPVVLHDRIMYIFANFVGTFVTVNLSDGNVLVGIYEGISTDLDFPEIVLAMVKSAGSKQVITKMVIKLIDVVSMSAEKVSFGNEKGRNGFMTDSAISGSSGELRERELKKWEPENELVEIDLEVPHKKWDQFAVNESLFGLKSSFQEEIYTTKLDKTSKIYKEKEKIAEKLANEMQKSSLNTTNIHVMEERGIEVDEQVDEEDRYGAVVRSKYLTEAERYVPPHLRKDDSEAKVTRKLSEQSESPGSSELPSFSERKINRKFSIQSNSITTKVGVDSTLVKIAEDFREFSASEKLLLQQKKQMILKKERMEKIEEMKRFSLSFKVPVRREKEEEPAFESNQSASKINSEMKFLDKTPSYSQVASSKKNDIKTEAKKEEIKIEITPKNEIPKSDFRSEDAVKNENQRKPEKKGLKFNVNAASFTPNANAVPFVPKTMTKVDLVALMDPFTKMASKKLQDFSKITLSFYCNREGSGTTWSYGDKTYKYELDRALWIDPRFSPTFYNDMPQYDEFTGYVMPPPQ